MGQFTGLMEQTRATEVHKDPYFNNQYHNAVWVQVWASGGTSDIEAPDGVPVTCAICGVPRTEPLIEEE